MHFRPEMAVILRAPTLPGMTERLAGVSPCNAINSSKSICIKSPYIVINRNTRKVFGDNLLCVVVAFNKRHGFKAAGPFKADGESTDTTE